MANRVALPLLFTIFAASAATVTAQSAAVPGGTRSKDGQFLFPNGAVMSRAELNAAGASLRPVIGHPYTAEQWMGSQSGPEAWRMWHTAKLYRDSEGRTRAEITVGWALHDLNPPVSFFVELIDPISGYRYILDPATKTAHRSLWPKANDIDKAEPYQGGEPLGNKTIDGLVTNGFRFRRLERSGQTTHMVSIDEWRSPELQIIVLSEENSPLTKTRVRVTNISRSEPLASIFHVPDDYTVTDESPETWWSVTSAVSPGVTRNLEIS